MVVVHASDGFDPSLSAKKPISDTLEDGFPRYNILELEATNIRHFSYLNLPKHLIVEKEFGGNFLGKEFFKKHRDLIEKTNTFIFIGGKVNQCITNAFLSVLISKLSPLEKIFLKIRTPFKSIQNNLSKLLALPRRADDYELNFHFNCEAIYPSYSPVAKNADALSWSPNLPWKILSTLGAWHNDLLAGSNLQVRNYVDGKELASKNKSDKEGRTVNLYYWTSAYKMKEVLGEKKILKEAA